MLGAHAACSARLAGVRSFAQLFASPPAAHRAPLPQPLPACSYDYLQLPPPGAPVEGGVGGVASGSGVTPSGSQQEVALAAVDGAEAKNV